MISFVTVLINETVPDIPLNDGLISEIAQGNMEAFHSLYQQTAEGVYGFALSILKNKYDAEDVLQETFLLVHSNAAGYNPQGKPMAWILTIARNLSLNKLKAHSKVTELQDNISGEGNDFLDIANLEHKLVLKAAFEILSDEERQILMLHAVGGMKFREIASVLVLGINTVLSKYHRAIKKMKQKLEGEEYL